MAGFDPVTGLTIPTQDEIRQEINAEVREVFAAPNADLGDRTALGRLIGRLSDRYLRLWQLFQVLYTQLLDPSAATGQFLVNIASLNGLVPLKPSKTTGDVLFTGDLGTVVAAGSQVQGVPFVGTAYETLTAGTIDTAADPWTPSTVFLPGEVVRTGGVVYRTLNGGTSGGGSTRPEHTQGEATSTDGVTWAALGAGTAYSSALTPVSALLEGAFIGVQYGIASIVTPIPGWTGVSNPEDFLTGRFEETSAELRARRASTLADPGTATIDAIAANLRAIDGVTSVILDVNDTDIPSITGVPPHAIEAIIEGGDDADIHRVLRLESVAAGIATHGNVIAVIEDSQGQPQTSAFSRFNNVAVTLEVDVLYDPNVFTTDLAQGEDLIKLALFTAGNSRGGGADIIPSALTVPIILSQPGILSVPGASFLVGTGGPLVAADIAVSFNQRATYDVADMTVNLIASTP